MRNAGRVVGLVVVLGSVGCVPLHQEMLTQAISSFSGKLKIAGTEKIWIAGPADSGCDRGCSSCGGGGISKGVGGLFGGGSKDGSSSYDKLAYEVFSNYMTQRKKARVVETHRHNYSTELNPETHKKVELVSDKMTTTSCEDLCMLDEAKKRKADKVLAYHIMMMTNDKLKIHFRLSNVQTGIVETSHTIKVENMRARDESFGEFYQGGGGGRSGSGGEVD